MTRSIAAIVVLYNPNKTFIENIYRYIDCLSLLVVVDNSETPDTSLIEHLSLDKRIKIVVNNENTGIGKAINTGVKIVTAYNYDWVLTMDQDSCFETEILERI